MRLNHLILLFLMLFGGFYPLGIKAQLNSSGVSDLLELAEEARQENENVEALRHYLQALQEIDSTQVTTRQKIERQIGIIYYEEKLYERALSYFLPLLDQTPNDTRLLERAAIASFQLEDYQGANEHYEKLTEIYQQEGRVGKVIESLKQLTEGARLTQQFEKAIEFERKILDLVLDSEDSTSIITALDATSSLLLSISESGVSNKDPRYQAARAAFEDVLRIRWKDGFLISQNPKVYLTIGLIKRNEGNNKAALINFRTAAQLLRQTSDSVQLGQAYQLMGSTYFDLEEMRLARLYVKEARRIAESQQLPALLAENYRLSSLIEQEEGKYEEALTAYKKHLRLRDSIEFEQRLRQEKLLREKQMLDRSEERIRLLLASQEVRNLEGERQRNELQLLRKNQELQEAALQQQKLLEKQARQQLLLTKRQLESERQRSALEELRQRDEIREAELEAQRIAQEKQQQEMVLLEEQKKNLEKDRELKDLELQTSRERQQYFLGLLVIGLGIIIAGTTFYISTRRKNKLLDKQKNELAYQNHQLDESNRQILSSIRYAKTIQSAMLPSARRMEVHLPPHYVFYRPRDIVSGDFYWFESVEESHFLAVADCTGHGVPGAFMSMIGNALLTRLIQVLGYTQPAQALDQFKEALFRILDNSDSSNNDGMDVGIFRFDPPDDSGSYPVMFAGAKLGGFLVRKNGQTHLLKPTRYSIGARVRHGKSVQFEEEQFTFEKGDALYIFSDGIPDQNPKDSRRGIGSKKFREWLTQHAHLSIAEQQQKFENFINELTKGVAQRDDMLLIMLKNE